MNFYTHSDIYELNKKVKSILRTIVIIMTVALLLCLLLVLRASYENYKIYLVVSIFISVVSGWFCIAIYYTEYLTLKKRIKFIIQINSQKRKHIITKCVFLNFVTLYNGQQIREIKSVDSEAVFYWETVLGDIPFQENKNVSLYIVDGFVVGYDEDGCYE